MTSPGRCAARARTVGSTSVDAWVVLLVEVLLNSVHSRGAALVIITHDARVAAYADREVTVRDGRISPGATHTAAGPSRPGHAEPGSPGSERSQS